MCLLPVDMYPDSAVLFLGDDSRGEPSCGETPVVTKATHTAALVSQPFPVSNAIVPMYLGGNGDTSGIFREVSRRENGMSVRSVVSS